LDSINRLSEQPEINSIVFTPELIKKMQEHVSQTNPEEACGLVAGKNGSAALVIPMINILHSPVRFRMDPREQLNAFNFIEGAGLELQAIYHSHPSGPETPSLTDINEAYYPEACSIIWSYNSGCWKYRCFSIQSGRVQELNLEIKPGYQ